jgi:hypothetical protein
MLAQALNAPVLIVLSAYGGQSIDTWVPTTGVNWPKLAAAVAAVGGDVEGMDWSQAEADTLTKTAAQMRAKWDGLQSEMLSILPATRNKQNFKIGMIPMGPAGGGYVTAGQAKAGDMRVNQTAYANSTDGWFLASSAYDGDTPADPIHQSGATYSRVYRRAALTRASVILGSGVSGAGPRLDPLGASLAGGVITASIIHTSGTALVDGAGGTTGAGVKSLEVRDATNAVIPYTLAISGAAQVKLTLSGSWTGPLTLSNAAMDVPCGTATSNISFTPAACLYDNITYVNGTTGAPLQPCAAFTVTGS